MGFLKKLLKKTKQSNSQNLKDEDNEKWIQYFESADENKVRRLGKTLNYLKSSNSEIAEPLQELIEAGLELNMMEKAQKIVNEYGQAIMKGTEINRRKTEEFMKQTIDQTIKSLKDQDPLHPLQGKFDIDLLSHDKETIKGAIGFLLEHETDSEKIDDLMRGLIFLDDFIDLKKSN